MKYMILDKNSTSFDVYFDFCTDLTFVIMLTEKRLLSTGTFSSS